jgi:hypothetical protein
MDGEEFEVEFSDAAWAAVLGVRDRLVDALKREIDFEPARAATVMLHWLERGDGLEELATACLPIYQGGYAARGEDFNDD